MAYENRINPEQVVTLARGISDRIAQNVALDIKRNIQPELDTINRLLDHAQTQRIATTEHAVIRDKKGFRRQVLERLHNISKMLPREHPVRREIAILRALEMER